MGVNALNTRLTLPALSPRARSREVHPQVSLDS